MIDNIEGIGCLYKLSLFIHGRDDLDIKKLEEYKILTLVPEVSESYETYYNEIIELLRVTEEPISKPKKIIQPQQQPEEEEGDIVDENLLAKNFNVTPKQQPILKETAYEKQQFNKILYNSGADDTEEDTAERLTLVESIEALRDELQRMEIKVNNIPQVDENSCMQDVKNVYKMLLHKKNVNIHFETARDLMLVGINQIVNFCDGRETAWGKRPNLLGWERTSRLKLNALKTELSTLASNFFRDYNIGPLAQIALSLIPSALMHASVRSQQSSLKTNNDNALQNLHNLL